MSFSLKITLEETPNGRASTLEEILFSHTFKLEVIPCMCRLERVLSNSALRRETPYSRACTLDSIVVPVR